MKKQVSVATTLCCMALTAACTFVCTMAFCPPLTGESPAQSQRIADLLPRLKELDSTVHERFYQEIDEEAVQNGLLSGYVSALGDKYSTFLCAEDYSDNQTQIAGMYTGIGVTVTKSEHSEILVMEVIENGPAAQAGIEAGDTIVFVEDYDVTKDYDTAVNSILGEAGTYVNLKIRKHDSDTIKTISVERRVIDEITVSYRMMENNIGYIRIEKFRTVSAEQFKKALDTLQQEGAQAILFDVRQNGGGLLSALEAMLDPILPEGEIAYAFYKNGDKDVILKSDAEMLTMPYAVLVDQYTASAAELFACAMRDYADAFLVGVTTFGKGIMQTTVPLSDGSAVTLTVATYATGITPCYHEIGLSPDMEVAYDPEAGTDNQLQAAYDALLKKCREK